MSFRPVKLVGSPTVVECDERPVPSGSVPKSRSGDDEHEWARSLMARRGLFRFTGIGSRNERNVRRRRETNRSATPTSA